MKRAFQHLVIVVLCLAPFVWLGTQSKAQTTPNPVTPGYVIERNTQGFIQQSWQQITSAMGLPVQPVGTANIATSQATAATTEVSVAAARAGRSAVTITNLGTTDVFCGPTGVLTTTGDLIIGTKGASKTYTTSAQVFCIVGTGTQAVSVVETY